MPIQQTQFLNGTSETGQLLTDSAVAGNSGQAQGIKSAFLTIKYVTGATEAGTALVIAPEFQNQLSGPWYPLSIGADSAPVSGVVTTTLHQNKLSVSGGAGGTTYLRTFYMNEDQLPGGFGVSSLIRCGVLESGVGANFGRVTIILSVLEYVAR